MPTYILTQDKDTMYNVGLIKSICVNDTYVICNFEGDDRQYKLGKYVTPAKAEYTFAKIVAWMNGDGCEFPFEGMEFVFEMPPADEGGTLF